MGRNYFDNPFCNVAFERCLDILAKLIEKYAGKFAMSDIGIYTTDHENEFISLTDIAKYKSDASNEKNED
ncbi:hypothetical protein [Pseudobutyrivibrio sp.]